MAIKAILFDIDNTLYDYDSVNQKALKATHKILKRYRDIGYDDFVKLFDRARTEIKSELSGTAASHNRVLYLQRLVEFTHGAIDPGLILKLYSAYWDCMFKRMRLKPGAMKVLEKARLKGYRIGILTDQTASVQLRKIDSLGIGGYIDILVTSEEAGRDKPHSSMYLLALNKLGMLPREAIMVGDNPIKDIQGAGRLGIRTIHVRYGMSSEDYPSGFIPPDYSTEDIKEVSALIDKIDKEENERIHTDAV